MNLLVDKTKEVAQTLIPVVILVLALSFIVVDVEINIIARFIVGSIMLLIGLSFFLWGVDLSMNGIGEYMAEEVATSKSFLKITILSFLLGFLITIAEPDLLILGSQIEGASGGTLSSSLIVYIVSVGVGILISLGVFRLLKDMPFNIFMAIVYGLIFVLALFVSEEFLAISFDASGATTGALTTPFILALSLGLSKIKGGKKTEENSFGLVGTMSAGPILAIMLLSIISGQKNIHGEAAEFVVAKGIFRPILDIIPSVFMESLVALAPIAVLFFVFNFVKFKIPKDELSEIIRGLVLLLLGLTLFLAAVNSGFMDMGRILGMELAKMSPWLLIGVGFLLGFIVVLVEPAVHVLGEQIEEVTGGHVPIKIIRMTLSIGVALAISLSMVRILVPGVKLWYFLLPGFALAILLSFKAQPVFVGIAYDAGGVASGPMTATFVLAFAQGAASSIDTANVLVDGFGVIAMVAMAPVLSLMLVGTIFSKKKVEEYVAIEDEYINLPSTPIEDSLTFDCLMVIVERGYSEEVIDLARQSGATGATIIHGRGTDDYHKVILPIMNIELQPEKEIMFFITKSNLSEQIAEHLLSNEKMRKEGRLIVYLCPVTDSVIKNLANANDENEGQE